MFYAYMHSKQRKAKKKEKPRKGMCAGICIMYYTCTCACMYYLSYCHLTLFTAWLLFFVVHVFVFITFIPDLTFDPIMHVAN